MTAPCIAADCQRRRAPDSNRCDTHYRLLVERVLRAMTAQRKGRVAS